MFQFIKSRSYFQQNIFICSRTFISKCFFLKHFILFSKQLLFLNSEYFFLEHLHLFWEHFILLCSIILFHFVLRTFHFCSRNNLHFFSVSFVQNNFSMEYFYMFQIILKYNNTFVFVLEFIFENCLQSLHVLPFSPVTCGSLLQPRLFNARGCALPISSYKVFQALLPSYSVR